MEKIFITKCLRCHGTVAYDKFYGPHGQFWGWKCLICVDIVDPLILANRRLMRTGQEIKVQRARI